MENIMVEGLPAVDYHADKLFGPTLSSSLAKLLWKKTPAHVFTAHPVLNPDFERVENGRFDLGTAAHHVLLEGDTGIIYVIDAPDWRKAAAKLERDAARADGLLPLLTKQADAVRAMVGVAQQYIRGTRLEWLLEPGAIVEGSMFANYKGARLRGRVDAMSPDRSIQLDYKTAAGADVPTFSRGVFNLGYDIQAAMYSLLNGLTGGPELSDWYWLAQEVEPPFACQIFGASGTVLSFGEQKLEYCVQQFVACLDSGVWPSYPADVAFPEPPPWDIAELEAKLVDAAGASL